MLVEANTSTQSAESVTRAHPDMACNIAADHFLDRAIEESAKVGARPRVALEVTAKGGISPEGENLAVFTPEMQDIIKDHGLVLVTGEVTLPSEVNLPVRETIVDGLWIAGYRDHLNEFSPRKDNIIVAINRQSFDIAKGVDPGGAGDQGAMVGYATDETDERVPLAVLVARELTKRQFELFESGAFDNGIRPDGKSQVTLTQIFENGRLIPRRIENLTVAVSHDPKISTRELRQFLIKEQIGPVLDKFGLKINEGTQLVINGTDKPWTIYGPTADAGTTNRKLIAQAYGLEAKHGGGGWSGKDPTKVDRSGSLFARYIAKSLVDAGIVKKCEVIITYSIGRPLPHIISINTYYTNAYGWSNEKIAELVRNNFSWTVSEMIDKLQLWQPIYTRTDTDGVLGVPDYPWERSKELK